MYISGALYRAKGPCLHFEILGILRYCCHTENRLIVCISSIAPIADRFQLLVSECKRISLTERVLP